MNILQYVAWAVVRRSAKIRMALMPMAYQLEKMYARYDAAAEARKMEVALVKMPVPVPAANPQGASFQ